MLKNRHYCLHPVHSAEELAHALTEETWPYCTAFQLGKCLWLNDHNQERGEYVIARQRHGLLYVINSVAFADLSFDKAIKFIRDDLRDRGGVGKSIPLVLEMPSHHGWCRWCKKRPATRKAAIK